MALFDITVWTFLDNQGFPFIPPKKSQQTEYSFVLSFFLGEFKVPKVSTKVFHPQGYPYFAHFEPGTPEIPSCGPHFFSPADTLVITWIILFSTLEISFLPNSSLSCTPLCSLNIKKATCITSLKFIILRKHKQIWYTNVTTIAGYTLNQSCSTVVVSTIRGHFGYLKRH